MMKKGGGRLMFVVALLMVLFTWGGILSIVLMKVTGNRRSHQDLLNDGTLTLEFIGPETVELQEPCAIMRGNELVVTGCLHRKSPDATFPSGGVDVAVLSADGELLHETTIHDLPTCTKGGKHCCTRFPMLPPDGSVLRIKCCTDREDVSRPESPSPDPGG